MSFSLPQLADYSSNLNENANAFILQKQISR